MGGIFSGIFSVNKEMDKTEKKEDCIAEIQKQKKKKKKKNNLLTPILQRPTN